MMDFVDMESVSAPSITFFGQAGFVFKTLSHTTLGLDLYLSDCVERSSDGFKRLSPKLVDPKELHLDFIAATHWHWDHYDVDAIPMMMSNSDTILIAAKDCKDEAAIFPENRKVFLSPGDAFEANDISVRAVFCDHGDAAPDAIGIVLKFDDISVYVAGDTCYRPDAVDEIAGFGPFDVMIAPINGAFGNLNETEAALLCDKHHPQLFIPCHYWMFAQHHGDPGRLINEMSRICPHQKYSLMRPGESINLRKVQSA